MIVLDTHIWVWWVHGDKRLTTQQNQRLQQYESQGLGVSAISCWEVAKLVEYGRLMLPCPVGDWMTQALAYPGIRLLELTPEIAVGSTQLPGVFHRDPADQIIVATARNYNCALLTADAKILSYPHVNILK
jgi:PIN domain nuclease of toxin-antitoxin system